MCKRYVGYCSFVPVLEVDVLGLVQLPKSLFVSGVRVFVSV